MLGQRNEFVRADRPQHRVMPAHEHLDLLHLIGTQADLGLETQGQLVATDGLAQIAGETQPAQMLLVLAKPVHAGATGGVADLAARDIGAPQQRVRVGAMFGNQRNADAGFELDARLRQRQRAAQLQQQALGFLLHGGRVGMRHHHHEFVAAKAPDDVGRLHHVGKPAPGFDQDLICEVVAQAVVEFLEALQVQDQHRCGAARGHGLIHHLLQLLQQPDAVGQASECVVACLVQDVLLARGDLLLHAPEAVGQLRQFAPGRQLHGGVVITALDAACCLHQQRHRLTDAAREKNRHAQCGGGGQASQQQNP